MADTPEHTIVNAISAAGWLQGDIVAGEALAEHISAGVLDDQFDGKSPTYWVLASHSCTVHARTFEDAPLVEWISVKVKKKSFAKHLNALNPRVLQLQVAERQILELKIHRRVWTSRAILPTLHRNPDITLSNELRGVFAYWLAHAYNRLAMPDELVNRLKAEHGDEGGRSIALLVDGFLEKNNHMLASAWVSFFPSWELGDPAEPYEVIFRFLTNRGHSRNVNELNVELNQLLGMARKLNEGLVFGGAEVSVLQDFTMLDAEDYIRYNLHDWLSVGDSDEALEDDDSHDGIQSDSAH